MDSIQNVKVRNNVHQKRTVTYADSPFLMDVFILSCDLSYHKSMVSDVIRVCKTWDINPVLSSTFP